MIQGDNYGSRARCALARLIFERDLAGSHWLSPVSRESIDRMVHYGDQCFVSGSGLALGGLLDSHPEYVSDICIQILSGKEGITREDFVASFLEKMLTNKVSELSWHIAQLGGEEAKTFNQMVRKYLSVRQIPVKNLYAALGVYILQKAQDQGVISMDDYQDGKVTLRQ